MVIIGQSTMGLQQSLTMKSANRLLRPFTAIINEALRYHYDYRKQWAWKNLSVRPRVGPKCGTHTSSAIQIHLITGYRSTHDFLHLEDFRNSDVEFCLEWEILTKNLISSHLSVKILLWLCYINASNQAHGHL